MSALRPSPSPSVLIVEDEDSFVEALTLGLQREGFVVHVARDGAEALDLFDDLAPDLVLLDLMLPKVSGVDVCREIGTTEQTYCRWKSRYGGMTQSELHRSRQLESENARLKRLLAERDLELDLARELLSKKS